MPATTAAEQLLEDVANLLDPTAGSFLHPEAVTYTIATTNTATPINAIGEHLVDLTPATQRPHFRRAWYVSTADIANPQRQDRITDAAGNEWAVFDVERVAEGGLVRLQTRIGQVRS